MPTTPAPRSSFRCWTSSITCSRAKSNVVAFMPVPKVARPRQGTTKNLRSEGSPEGLARDDRELPAHRAGLWRRMMCSYAIAPWTSCGDPWPAFVRFVIVHHPARGTIFLLCTDLSLEPCRSCTLRVPIQDRTRFRQAVHVLGAYAYHFWMADMSRCVAALATSICIAPRTPIAKPVRRKLRAYHVPCSTRLHRSGIAAAPGPESHRCSLALLSQLAAHHEIRPCRPPS